MADAPIRILVVDDHALVREGIRQALTVPGFQVVGEAGSGPEALERAIALAPDVVVLDISLPGENGIKTAGRIRVEMPAVRILMLSVHDHPEYVMESVKAGAHGYLRKDTLPEDLRAAIRSIHEGDTCFGNVLSDEVETVTPILQTNATQRLELLTRRERDVLIGVAGGKTNKEIAGALGLSPRTVESYRESLIRKLGIPSVAGLTRFAIDAGLLAG
ncbi:MAG: NarL family two-component response regulator [Gemmatimonadetes bacterium]|nr:NarL family two-component response regulator [Gemmatimonadota bacterium]